MPTLLQYFAQQVQMLEEDEEDLDAPLPEGQFHVPKISVQQVPATPVSGGITSSAAITAFIGVHGGPIPAAAGAVGLPSPEQTLPDAGIDMDQDRKRKGINPLDNPEAADPLFEQQADDDLLGSLVQKGTRWCSKDSWRKQLLIRVRHHRPPRPPRHPRCQTPSAPKEGQRGLRSPSLWKKPERMPRKMLKALLFPRLMLLLVLVMESFQV